MAGQIAELYGYLDRDTSDKAVNAAIEAQCPFIRDDCVKTINLHGRSARAGACTVRQKRQDAPDVICCPLRLYAGDYALLDEISRLAFGESAPKYPGREAVDRALLAGEPSIAVFGHRWGKELRLPMRGGSGNYFVDWILAKVEADGKVSDFCAVEVQTIDTTGNYRSSLESLSASDRLNSWSTLGLNWENVNKRILPQIIYKASVLSRETYCRSGLFLVTPEPVNQAIIQRLGGESNIERVGRLQPSSITLVSYDFAAEAFEPGVPRKLEIKNILMTNVSEVKDAFNRAQLPEPNVYGSALTRALKTPFCETQIPRVFR